MMPGRLRSIPVSIFFIPSMHGGRVLQVISEEETLDVLTGEPVMDQALSADSFRGIQGRRGCCL